MTEPQPLGELLPGLAEHLGDLARRNGHRPPTTLTDRSHNMTDCHFCNEPMDNTNEGPRSGDVVVCVDCASLGEPDQDGAA